MEELDLKELLRIVWRKKISIIVIVIISIVVGCVYSYNYITPRYNSTATVILGKVSSTVGGDRWSENITISESDLNLNSSLILTYSELVGSRSIMEEVRERLNSNVSVEDIMESVTVNRVSTSDLLEVTATSTDPVLAKNIVTEVVDVFSEYVKEIYKIENVYIIDKPAINYEPYNINHIRDIAISVCIGVFLSFVYVSIYAFADNTVKDGEDMEEYLKVKTLINIPYDKNKKEELITVNDGKSIISEAFKTLRTNIQFSNVDLKGAQTLLITSCLPSEGKSYVSANLAISFAQVGKKVILVDSDMRRGRQSKIFNLPKTNGLSNYISNIDSNGMEINWSLGEYIKKTNVKNLDLITAGSVPPNPAELLASPKLAELIELLKNYYDIVIFDGAPILPITDSLLLGRVLEKVMLVAVHNKTKKDNLLKAKTSIEDVGGKVIGIALNKVSISTGNYGDRYYYYYSAEEKENKAKKFIRTETQKVKTWCINLVKKAKSIKKRLGAGRSPEEKALIEKRKAELAKQREAEKRIKVVEIEEKARKAKEEAEAKAKKDAELAKQREVEKAKLAEEKAKKDAELAKEKEAEKLKREKEKKELEEKKLQEQKQAEEERAKEEAIMAEERAKQEAEEAKRREAEEKLKQELKKKKEEERALKRKENAEKRAKLKADFKAKVNDLHENALAKKEEYAKKYKEYKIRKQEENRIKQEERARKAKEEAELKAKRAEELAKIREAERIKREEERRILEEERIKKEEELAKQREEERIRKEEERRILAEEKARREEEAKYTEEYLQENLYPKTKYNKF